MNYTSHFKLKRYRTGAWTSNFYRKLRVNAMHAAKWNETKIKFCIDLQYSSFDVKMKMGHINGRVKHRAAYLRVSHHLLTYLKVTHYLLTLSESFPLFVNPISKFPIYLLTQSQSYPLFVNPISKFPIICKPCLQVTHYLLTLSQSFPLSI